MNKDKFNNKLTKMVSEIVASLLVGTILAAAMTVLLPFLLVRWQPGMGDYSPNAYSLLWWAGVGAAFLTGFIMRILQPLNNK